MIRRYDETKLTYKNIKTKDVFSYFMWPLLDWSAEQSKSMWSGMIECFVFPCYTIYSSIRILASVPCDKFYLIPPYRNLICLLTFVSSFLYLFYFCSFPNLSHIYEGKGEVTDEPHPKKSSGCICSLGKVKVYSQD
jgi:hypothetical protein